MDFKRIATIIDVAVAGYIGFYVVYYIYNILEWLLAGGRGGQMPLAIFTAIIAAIVYTVKTRRQ